MRSSASTELLSSILLKRDKILALVEGDVCCGPVPAAEQFRIVQVTALVMHAIEIVEDPDNALISITPDLEDIDECAWHLLCDFERFKANGSRP